MFCYYASTTLRLYLRIFPIITRTICDLKQAAVYREIALKKASFFCWTKKVAEEGANIFDGVLGGGGRGRGELVPLR